MEIEDKEEYTCKEVGAYLDMTAMHIGRIRNECCEASDLSEDGKKILKTGLQKICNFLKREMNLIESGKPDIVRVQVIKQPCKHPRHLFAKDIERRRKCHVMVPQRDKLRLDKAGTILTVERISKNADFKYLWTRKTQQSTATA
jgi:hypothetical protein